MVDASAYRDRGWIWPPAAAFCLKIWLFFQQKASLTPELKVALEEVVKRRLFREKMDLLGQALKAIAWIGGYGKELTDVVQRVLEGVQLAEAFWRSRDRKRRNTLVPW